jgi:hypothetical protein
MSWRIMIDPACFQDGTQDGADAVIPQNATDEEVDRVAAEYAWQRPLKIWTPDPKDPRFLRLVQTLSDEHGVDDTCYSVFVVPKIKFREFL